MNKYKKVYETKVIANSSYTHTPANRRMPVTINYSYCGEDDGGVPYRNLPGIFPLGTKFRITIEEL